MADKVQTKRMGNFDMASAGDRIKAFWEMYPGGKIETVSERKESEENKLIYTTYIWKNKKDYLDLAKIPGLDKDVVLSSADVNAAAKQGDDKVAKKDYEKLETISVGRALALLGFLKDGQVASSEEMEEFNEYKMTKLEEETATAIEYLNESTDIKDLGKRWVELSGDIKKVKEVFDRKELLKAKFLIDEKKQEEKDKKEQKEAK